MKKTLLLAALFSFAIAAPAFAADPVEFKSETKVEKDKDGDSKVTTESKATDAAGTTTTSEKEVKVDAKDNGDFKKTTETKDKKDPKGLFNSSKTTTKETVEQKDGIVTTETEKKVDGEKVIDTKTEKAAH